MSASRRVTMLTGVIIVGATVLFASAGTTSARSMEDIFESRLHNQGIDLARQVAIDAGIGVCRSADDGQSAATVRHIVASQTGLPDDEVEVFVNLAVDSFCPEHTGDL